MLSAHSDLALKAQSSLKYGADCMLNADANVPLKA
jgi:hypothetical protein